MQLISDKDSTLFRQASILQTDMQRHIEALRGYEDTAPQYFSLDPLSPHATGSDDRRPSLQNIPSTSRPSFFRPPVPAHLNLASQRRYGSISGSIASPQPSPSLFNRSAGTQQSAPQQHTPHPLSSVVSHGSASSSISGPSLARRHTSADIRNTEGWPPEGPQSSNHPGSALHIPYEQGPPVWPQSGSPGSRPSQALPHQANAADQHIRDSLANYEFGTPRRGFAMAVAEHTPTGAAAFDPTAGPPGGGTGAWGSFSFGGGGGSASASGSMRSAKGIMDSAPTTRRSSMAHLLNPADVGEEDEDEGLGRDKKRKR